MTSLPDLRIGYTTATTQTPLLVILGLLALKQHASQLHLPSASYFRGNVSSRGYSQTGSKHQTDIRLHSYQFVHNSIRIRGHHVWVWWRSLSQNFTTASEHLLAMPEPVCECLFREALKENAHSGTATDQPEVLSNKIMTLSYLSKVDD
jgi:hypothetical protein